MRRTWRNLLYTGWDVAWIRLDESLSTLRSRVSLAWQGCPAGAGFCTTGPCSFKARTAQSIRIGNRVRFLAGWRSNRVGLASPVLLQTFGQGVIEVGDDSGGSGVVLSARSRISIGRHVNLGGNVRVFDHDFHALEPEKRRLPMREQEAAVRSEPVEIGDDVFVGANALILKGAKIGARSIVAAGAVVFRGEYAPDSLLVGNPAVVRTRSGRS